MVASRYALILDGDVVNVILWDSSDNYNVPSGHTLLSAPDYVAPGWGYVNSEWVPPVPPEPEPIPTEDPTVTAAKEAALQDLMSIGVSEANARTIVGLPVG